MILLHTVVVFLCLLLSTQTPAQSIDRLKKRSSTSAPDILESVVAPADAFKDGAGFFCHQLVAVGPTHPNGSTQTYQNSAVPESLHCG
jgi:hypothetical protein